MKRLIKYLPLFIRSLFTVNAALRSRIAELEKENNELSFQKGEHMIEIGNLVHLISELEEKNPNVVLPVYW